MNNYDTMGNKAENAADKAQDKAANFAERVADKTQQAANAVADKAQQVADGAHRTAFDVRTADAGGTVHDIKGQAQDTIETVKAKADDAVAVAKDKAAEIGANAENKANDAMSATGEQMTTLASLLAEKAPDGKAGEITMNAADAIERGGNYLKDSDVASVRSDLERVIRDHPIEALAVGLGVGYLLARASRR